MRAVWFALVILVAGCLSDPPPFTGLPEDHVPTTGTQADKVTVVTFTGLAQESGPDYAWNPRLCDAIGVGPPNSVLILNQSTEVWFVGDPPGSEERMLFVSGVWPRYLHGCNQNNPDNLHAHWVKESALASFSMAGAEANWTLESRADGILWNSTLVHFGESLPVEFHAKVTLPPSNSSKNGTYSFDAGFVARVFQVNATDVHPMESQWDLYQRP